MPHKEKKLWSSDTVILRTSLEDRADRFGDMQPRHGTTVPSLLEANSYILVNTSKTAPRKETRQDSHNCFFVGGLYEGQRGCRWCQPTNNVTHSEPQTWALERSVSCFTKRTSAENRETRHPKCDDDATASSGCCDALMLLCQIFQLCRE